MGQGNKVPGDLDEQFTQAFEHVKTTLEAAGATMDDIVDMTTYHVDLQKNIATFMKVKARYLKSPFPAWTAIGISELAFPGGMVEIKVTARLK